MRTAADTFRPNPDFRTDEAITQLETGEALVSLLDAKGAPGIVQRAKILFPLSQIGPITSQQREAIMRSSRLAGKYDQMVDRESAYEVLQRESQLQPADEPAVPATQDKPGKPDKPAKSGGKETQASKSNGIFGKVLKAALTAVTATVATAAGTAVSDAVSGKKTKSKTSTGQKIVKNTTSAATRTITRELTRGILGNLIK